MRQQYAFHIDFSIWQKVEKEPNISWLVDLAPSGEITRSGTRVIGLLHAGGMAKTRTPADHVDALHSQPRAKKMIAEYLVYVILLCYA